MGYVADTEDGHVESISRSEAAQASSYGIGIDEVVIYGTPKQLEAFGQRFLAMVKRAQPSAHQNDHSTTWIHTRPTPAE
jgi:hypothetical protein